MTPNDKLSNWPDAAAQANARRSVLASDLVIEGDVTSGGPVEVQGKIVGSARAPEVLVASTGRIEGAVSAHELSVLGSVTGSVSARHVQLMPSAVVHADVLHERISIEAGAEFEGRLQRTA
jgi:cytoskeletal protein CcmA (bactofilin family)